MKIQGFCCALSSCAAAALLAGCDGPSPPIGASGAVAPRAAALGNAERGPKLIQPASRAKRIYLTWTYKGAAQIQAYPATANGNVPATTWIAGDKTQLDSPGQIYVAPSGSLYTCNFHDQRILGFAPNARGNVAPIRSISGSNNPVNACDGVAVYAGRVAAVGFQPPKNRVVAWSEDSNGNVAPTRLIFGPATKLDSPSDVAFDTSGNLYVTNSDSNTITVYAPSADGDAAPMRMIDGSLTGLSRPHALAIDETSQLIYIANGAQEIIAYKLSQGGNVKPTVTIDGAKTGLDYPSGVAVDAAGYIYVMNYPNTGGPFLTVYAPGSNGDVAPVQTIKGKVGMGGRIAVK